MLTSSAPTSGLEYDLLQRLNHRFARLQCVLYHLLETEEKSNAVKQKGKGGDEVEGVPGQGEGKKDLLCMGSQPLPEKDIQEELKAIVESRIPGMTRKSQEEQEEKEDPKQQNRRQEAVASLQRLDRILEHLSVLEKQHEVYVWPPPMTLLHPSHSLWREGKRKGSRYKKKHGTHLHETPHTTHRGESEDRQSSHSSRSSRTWRTRGSSSSENSSLASRSSSLESENSERSTSSSTSNPRHESEDAAIKGKRRHITQEGTPHGWTVFPHPSHRAEGHGRAALWWERNLDTLRTAYGDGETSLGKAAAYQRACYEELIHPFFFTTTTTPPPSRTALPSSISLPYDRRGHARGSLSSFHVSQRALAMRGKMREGHRGHPTESSSLTRLPLAFHPMYLSGGLKIPFPYDIERSKRQWEKELSIVEDLQARYGHTILEARARCERLFHRCQLLFQSLASSARDAFSSSSTGEGAVEEDGAKVLHRWIAFQPQYDIGSSPEEEAIWKRISRISGNPLCKEEMEPSSSSHASPSSLSSSSSSPPSCPCRPRTLQDLYVLCKENEQRYTAMKQRWSCMKQDYMQVVSVANAYLSKITLQLDEIEDERAMKEEKEERERARREEEEWTYK